MADVAELVSQMHETLLGIHSTLSSLSGLDHAAQLDDLEARCKAAVAALQSDYAHASDDRARARAAQLAAVAEQRRREDEERAARRRREDEERAAQAAEEDRVRAAELAQAARAVEDAAEARMDDVEAEAQRARDAGQAQLDALEARRQELNRRIDEQVRQPLCVALPQRRPRKKREMQAEATSEPPLPDAPANTTFPTDSEHGEATGSGCDASQAAAAEPPADTGTAVAAEPEAAPALGADSAPVPAEVALVSEADAVPVPSNQEAASAHEVVSTPGAQPPESTTETATSTVPEETTKPDAGEDAPQQPDHPSGRIEPAKDTPVDAPAEPRHEPAPVQEGQPETLHNEPHNELREALDEEPHEEPHEESHDNLCEPQLEPEMARQHEDPAEQELPHTETEPDAPVPAVLNGGAELEGRPDCETEAPAAEAAVAEAVVQPSPLSEEPAGGDIVDKTAPYESASREPRGGDHNGAALSASAEDLVATADEPAETREQPEATQEPVSGIKEEAHDPEASFTAHDEPSNLCPPEQALDKVAVQGGVVQEPSQGLLPAAAIAAESLPVGENLSKAPTDPTQALDEQEVEHLEAQPPHDESAQVEASGGAHEVDVEPIQEQRHRDEEPKEEPVHDVEAQHMPALEDAPVHEEPVQEQAPDHEEEPRHHELVCKETAHEEAPAPKQEVPAEVDDPDEAAHAGGAAASAVHDGMPGLEAENTATVHGQDALFDDTSDGAEPEADLHDAGAHEQVHQVVPLAEPVDSSVDIPATPETMVGDGSLEAHGQQRQVAESEPSADELGTATVLSEETYVPGAHRSSADEAEAADRPVTPEAAGEGDCSFRGLASSRHAPSRQDDELAYGDSQLTPVTPPQQTSGRAAAPEEPAAWAADEELKPRDVTNTPWHARNKSSRSSIDDTPGSVRSQATLTWSASNTPSPWTAGAATPRQLGGNSGSGGGDRGVGGAGAEPAIRGSWSSTPDGYSGAGYGGTQDGLLLLDRSKPIGRLDYDGHVVVAATATATATGEEAKQRLALDTVPPGSGEQPARSRPSSLAAAPPSNLFQRMRSIFEPPPPSAGGAPNASSSSGPGSALLSRPPVGDGAYAEEEEEDDKNDDDGITEKSSLLLQQPAVDTVHPSY